MSTPRPSTTHNPAARENTKTGAPDTRRFWLLGAMAVGALATLGWVMMPSTPARFDKSREGKSRSAEEASASSRSGHASEKGAGPSRARVSRRTGTARLTVPQLEEQSLGLMEEMAGVVTEYQHSCSSMLDALEVLVDENREFIVTMQRTFRNTTDEEALARTAKYKTRMDPALEVLRPVGLRCPEAEPYVSLFFDRNATIPAPRITQQPAGAVVQTTADGVPVGIPEAH